MNDFLLEEKAKRFMSGETISTDTTAIPQQSSVVDEKMTKEKFDEIVGEFIKKHGNIRKIDFTVGFIFLIIHIETKAITNTGNIAILKKEVVNEINKNKTKFMKDFFSINLYK